MGLSWRKSLGKTDLVAVATHGGTFAGGTTALGALARDVTLAAAAVAGLRAHVTTARVAAGLLAVTA